MQTVNFRGCRPDWKIYPLDKFDDAAIAHELLAILYGVYGYNGLPKLKVLTEDSRRQRPTEFILA